MNYKCSYTDLVDVDKLVENPLNSNKHPDRQIEMLAKIIDFQGQRSPIVVSKRSGFITKGHGRLMALKKLGWAQAAVDYQEYDNEAQEYADLIADNKIAELADHDDSFMIENIKNLKLDLDFELLGLEDFNIPEVKVLDEENEDTIPEQVDTRAKLGDIWQLGQHRLMCGDSTNIEAVGSLMNGQQASMVWTDPPYNIDYEGKTKDALKIKNDKMSDDSFYKFLYDAFLSMFVSTRAGGSIYIAHADTEGINFRKAMVDSGWMMKQCLVWVKNTLVMGRSDYHWKHEPVLYGWKEGAAHTWNNDRKQTTLLEFDKPSRSGEHPTMKPVELIEYCINNSCPNTGSVLDLFGGSGSTLIACEKTNRKCYMMELDPKYVDVILSRWEKYTGKKAELIS